MNSLYHAYISGEDRVADLYEALPASLFRDRHSPAPFPPAMAEQVNRYQQQLGVEKTDLPPQCRVIITGQQAGLFGGPLYTVYKTITAIQLAERVSRPDAPVIPLFWTASDDHDFEEINHATLVTRRHDLLTLRYTPSPADGYVKGMPAGEIPLTGQLNKLIDQAAAVTPSSECTEEIRDFLIRALGESASVAEWFSRIQARLFARTALRLFDPRLPAARRTAAAILEQEIEAPLESTALLMRQGDILESRGFGRPIRRTETMCNFFLEIEKIRCTMFYENGRFHAPEAERSFSKPEMKALLAARPELFSGNVALRPIIQQALFPVLAYVAGPGEIAYWAQLKPLFNLFDQPMPIVYPRMKGLITTLKNNKLRKRFSADTTQPFDLNQVLTRALEQEHANRYHNAFQKGRISLDDAFAHFLAPFLAPGTPAAVQQLAQRFQKNQQFYFDRFGKALLFSDQEKRKTLENQLTRLHCFFSPNGKEQERVLSLFSFLFEQGWSLIDRMLDVFSPDKTGVQEFEL